MARSAENIYTSKLADGFRLVVECNHDEDSICFKWKIEVLETDGTVFGVTSDGEAYDSKSSAEVSGRLYFLMNYAHH